MNKTQIEALLAEHDVTDYKWLNPADIIVAQWVRMKCTFGCPNYGRNACCPPNMPTVAECREFFDEYDHALVLHFAKALEKPEDRGPWSKQLNQALLRLEREVFMAGYPKAFLLFMDSCRLCDDCVGRRSECKQPKSARPSPESLAMDVFSTVRQCGYPIEVLSDYTQTMNRYAFLLLE
jgi:predicted metal-binding protein